MRRAILVLAAVSLVSCAHYYPAESVANPCVGGGTGDPDPNHPIVCINSSTLIANPDPVTVKRGAWVHFFIDGDIGELDCEFTSDTPLRHKGHEGAHYWGQAKKVSKKFEGKYTIHERRSGKKNDPTIIIEP